MAAPLFRRLSSSIARFPSRLLPSASLETPFAAAAASDAPAFSPSIPTLPVGSSIELMAVPKKKVSRHKRGIRNGPKALKPIPVIVRCKSCGRVKLPHFYCCSGDRGGSNISS